MLLKSLVILALLLHSAAAAVGACSEHCALCEQGRCSECIYGWHGHKCNSKCEHCWISGCHKHSGICVQCKPGRYKEDCKTPCPENCRHDRSGEVYCDRKIGKCLDGCKEGWWGETCNRKCSEHCETGTCLQTNGQCFGACRAGWWGSECTDKCLVHCIKDECKRLTGSCKFRLGVKHCKNDRYFGSGTSTFCIDGCNRGWTARSCNEKCHGTCLKCDQFTKICEECPLSLYGNDCSKESTNCKASECDVYGRCTKGCIDGFRGSSCNETCPSNCLTCDQESDDCTECKTGMNGRLCQHQSPRTLDPEPEPLAEKSGCGPKFDSTWLLIWTIYPVWFKLVKHYTDCCAAI